MPAVTDNQDENWIEFSALEGGQTMGRLRQLSRKMWKEDSIAHGPGVFDFAEIDRKSGLIEIFDASRNATLVININRKTIFYDDDGKVLRPLYTIGSTSTKPNGWLASYVGYGSGPDDVQGIFIQTSPTHWLEQSPDAKTLFELEETGRDDWSVYLIDRSRNVKLQLDLYRNKVLYGVGDAKLTDLYDVVSASTKVTGWLTNQVDYTAGGVNLAGSYRQTGIKTWVEDTVKDGLSQFEFHETNRDDWSVYLQDAGRGVSLQLDLHTRKIFYSDAKSSRYELYKIAHADVQSRLGVENGRTVNWLETGDSSGNVTGAYRQTGPDSWAEEGNTPGQTRFEFQEVTRDQWSVYLFDPSRSLSIKLDLDQGKVFFSTSQQAKTELASILNASSKLTGWLINTVFASDGSKVVSVFEQTGWTSWVEVDADGNDLFEFDETGRDAGSIQLHDPSRDLRLQIDLNANKILYAQGQAALTALYSVTEATRSREYWCGQNRITSRCALAEDFAAAPGSTSVTSTQVYRTIVTLPPNTRFVDVWASEEVQVQINEESHTIDPVSVARVRPTTLSRLTISMPATALHCAKLILRSNLMKKDEQYAITPDVEAHKKIVNFKPGQLSGARGKLGLSSDLSNDDIDNIQTSLQNIAKTTQYSYNYTYSGVQRDRALLPANMQDPHFMVDFSKGGASYKALSKDDVLRHTAGARMLESPAAQGIFDDIGNFFSQATQVVVHTAENVWSDVVDTTQHVVADTTATVDHVGEALVHGDILEAGKALIEGGESVGKDLVTGVTDVAGDVVKGAGQLVVVTLNLGAELVQFVIDHTGFVGQALGALLEKAGAVLGQFVGWLLDDIGWDDVIHTHDVISDGLNRKLTQLAAAPAQLKQVSDTFFADLAGKIGHDLDAALNAMGVQHLAAQPAPMEGHSAAVEKIEWLLGKFVHYFNPTSAPGQVLIADAGAGAQTTLAALDTPWTRFAKQMEDAVGAEGSNVQAAFGDAMAHLEHLFSSQDQVAQDLLGAMLGLIKGATLVSLNIVSKIIDTALDLLADIVAELKIAINTEIDVPFLSAFYAGIAGGRKLTLLSVASLLVAVPTTMMHKAIYGTAPFSAGGAALALAKQNRQTQAFGIMYGCAQIGLSISAGITDLMALADTTRANKAKRADGQLQVGPKRLAVAQSMEKVGSLGPEDNGGISGLLLAANFVLTGIALWLGNPYGPGAAWAAIEEQQKFDPLAAPNYWATVAWWFVLAESGAGFAASIGSAGAKGLGAAAGKLKITNDIIAGYNCATGVVTMALMSVIDVADRKKVELLEHYLADGHSLDVKPGNNNDTANALIEWIQQNFSTYSPYATSGATYVDTSKVAAMSDDDAGKWLAALTNYHAWAWGTEGGGQGLPLKGYSNVMDAFPGIGQFGLISGIAEMSEGISVLVALVLCDAFGHLGEGITYITRSSANGLL